MSVNKSSDINWFVCWDQGGREGGRDVSKNPHTSHVIHSYRSKKCSHYSGQFLVPGAWSSHVLNTFPSDPIRPRPRRGKRVGGGGGASLYPGLT